MQSTITSTLNCVCNYYGFHSTTKYEHSPQQQSKPTTGLCPMPDNLVLRFSQPALMFTLSFTGLATMCHKADTCLTGHDVVLLGAWLRRTSTLQVTGKIL